MFTVLVEHYEGETPTDEEIEEYVDSLTCDDWFDRFGADRPRIDVDLEEECLDTLDAKARKLPENQPNVRYTRESGSLFGRWSMVR